jgi:class 3 adenylate cyclase/tetratricopeptide (TPR) repeat protein
MECPECQFVNRDGAKFCKKCGNKLELLCPSCGHLNQADSLFCDECGYNLKTPEQAPSIDFSAPQSYTPKFLAEKILTSRSSIEGERKLVTVLFADVADYTAMAEKLDPEEVHQIMDGCFKILMDEIHEFEGTINQFTGDGVMALFGAPVAHEDHAQRACHAALAIQRAIGDFGQKVKKDYEADFKVRIGLNSGSVIVGAIGDDLRMDYTAVGDTANLAARVQQAAKAGQVWVSQDTRNIIQNYFQDESVGKIPLKGKAQLQTVYRVMSERPGVHTRFEAGLVRGMTELVGRRPEREALMAALERARGSSGQVLDVVGEAGIGKSRLVYEFQRNLDPDVRFFTGNCIQYGRNINFLPVIDVVKAAFGIKEEMTEEEAGSRIDEKAIDNLKPMIPFYCSLLSLKTDDPKFNALNPEGRKFGTFEAVKNLMLNMSEENPLVVFLDDVHWMDKISEEFFTYFSHSISEHPILMLTAYRPEGSPPWAKGAHYQRLGLETISTKSSIHLVRNIVGGLPLEPALEQKIASRTGGNPFFIEEVVMELLDRGDLVKTDEGYQPTRPINQLEIPNTVHGVLAARMDRLSEDLKRTMQVASVIGRDFAFRLLKSIMELGEGLRSQLTNLVGLEILYEKALYPELEYIFKHALTQEVAYESLLKQRRREIHGRIAHAIEELYADRLERHYELLAHHWELSDSPDRSIEYLVLAGEKSHSNQAVHTAVDFFTRALNQIEKLDSALGPGLMMRIKESRADCFHGMGKIEECYEDYQEAVQLVRESGDQQKLLSVLSKIPVLIYNTTFKDKTPYFCEEGLKLARDLKDRGAEACLTTIHSWWHFIWKGSDEYETIQRALAMAEKSGQLLAIGFNQAYLSVLERWRGNPQRALELIENLVKVLQSQFNIHGANYLNLLFSWDLTELGRYKEAIRHLNQGTDIAEKNSLYYFICRYYNTLGWTYSEIYNLQQSFRFNNQALENIVALKKRPAMYYIASEIRAMTEVNLMENKFEMGKIDDAWKDLTRLEEEIVSSDFDLARDRWSTRMKDLKGIILLRRGDLEGAEALAQQCLHVATKQHYKKYIGRAQRLFGHILIEKGAHDLAEAKLMDALSKLKEVGNPKQLWITHSTLARLYNRMKKPDLERKHWRQAAALIESTASGLQEEALRNTFLNATQVQEILKQFKL